VASVQQMLSVVRMGQKSVVIPAIIVNYSLVLPKWIHLLHLLLRVVMERAIVEKHATAVRAIAVYAHLLLPHHHPPVEMERAIAEKIAQAA